MTTIFRHPVFAQLTDTERVVLLYLVAGPQRSRIGLGTLHWEMLAADLGKVPAAIVPAAKALCGRLRWQYDEKAFVLWMPTWWKVFPPASETEFRCALEDLKAVPASPLKDAFLAHVAHLPAAWHPILEGVKQGFSPHRKVRAVAGEVTASTDLLGAKPSKPVLVVDNALVASVVDEWNTVVRSRTELARVLPMVSKPTNELKAMIVARWASWSHQRYFGQAFRGLASQGWISEGKFPATIRTVLKSDDKFQTYLDAGAAVGNVTNVRPVGCSHRPACSSQAACTDLLMRGTG